MSAIVRAMTDQVCASLTLHYTTSATRGAVLDSSVRFIEKGESQVYFGKAEIHDIHSKMHEGQHYKPPGEDGGHTVMFPWRWKSSV